MVGDEVPDTDVRERGGRVIEREPLGLGSGPDARVHLRQGVREAMQVLVVGRGDDVDIDRDVGRSVDHRREPPDQDRADAVRGEHTQDPFRSELNVRHERSPSVRLARTPVRLGDGGPADPV